MTLRVEADRLIITSEDAMDVKFLEFLFEDSVQIKKECNAVYHGFHKTDEQSVCVTLEKPGG